MALGGAFMSSCVFIGAVPEALQQCVITTLAARQVLGDFTLLMSLSERQREYCYRHRDSFALVYKVVAACHSTSNVKLL